jgi:hypothetical protein
VMVQARATFAIVLVEGTFCQCWQFVDVRYPVGKYLLATSA